MNTIGDIIRLNARQFPHEEALVMGDVRLTYAALNTEVNRIASALSGRGVGPGDRVAALGRNSLEYVYLYFALAKLGAMLVPLNVWHRSDEHRYVLEDAAPAIVFVEDDFRPVLPEQPAIETIPLPTGPGAGPGRDGWDKFAAGSATAAEPTHRPSSDDAHMILYTSGTTGRPKGAVLSHGRTVQDALAMTAALGIRQSDTYINYFPPFHVANWDHMKLYLLMAARVVLQREFDAGVALELMEREGVTVILGVPTMLQALLDHPEVHDRDLSRVRLIYYGAYDPSGVLQRTAEFFHVREGGAEMAHTYGLTEGGPFVTVCPPHQVFSHWGSIGRPIPGVEVELQDPAGQAVPPGQPGEICIRGPRLTRYWNKPDETAEALRGDWFHTGDVAVADEDGFMRIVDRTKDMIRSGGQNVYSKQVEDCLQGHPGIRDVAVIGVPDLKYEETVCAVVIPAEEVTPGDELADDIRRYVRERLAGYNVPRRIEFVDELPKNAVGKTLKHVLRGQYGSVFDGPDPRPDQLNAPTTTEGVGTRA